MQKAWRTSVTLSAFLCLCSINCMAQTDSVRILHDFEVDYRQPLQGIARRTDGSICITSEALRRGIHVLGEADALTASSMLPGIESAGDYTSGIAVNGNDYTHTAYSLDGATVFFPYRFGGIFSDFNPAHYPRLVISTNPDASSISALGAVYDAYTYNNLYDTPTQTAATANVGVLSSGITLATGLGQRTSVKASARVSYLNMLYDWLLTGGDQDVRYAFDDFNLSLRHALGLHSTFSINAFRSNDNLRFDDSGFRSDTRLRWANTGASATFATHDDRRSYTQRFSWSAFDSRLSLALPQMSLNVPASVYQLSAAGDVHTLNRSTTYGYRLEYDKYTPQRSESQGMIDINSSKRQYTSWSVAAGGSHMFDCSEAQTIKASLRAVIYGSGSYHNISLNPSLTHTWSDDNNIATATLSYASQYMHCVGFSDIGLASNFFLPSTRAMPAEQAYGIDLGYDCKPQRWRGVTISVQAYAKRVTNTPEYTGTALSLIDDDYDPVASVVNGKGYNVGGNATVHYDHGALNGFAGYALAWSRREYADAPGVWTYAPNVPMHSFKLAVGYRADRRLNLSAFFSIASGRPYTPVNAAFIISGNVITHYGVRNSAQLPAYHRLDLSATYDLAPIRIGRCDIKHYINVSLLNAYGHDNIEMQYYSYDKDNNTVYLRQVRSIMRFLPSVSYTVSL